MAGDCSYLSAEARSEEARAPNSRFGSSSLQVPHHIHRMTLRIPSPDVAEGPDGVMVSSRRDLMEFCSVIEET